MTRFTSRKKHIDNLSNFAILTREVTTPKSDFQIHQVYIIVWYTSSLYCPQSMAYISGKVLPVKISWFGQLLIIVDCLIVRSFGNLVSVKDLMHNGHLLVLFDVLVAFASKPQRGSIFPIQLQCLLIIVVVVIILVLIIRLRTKPMNRSPPNSGNNRHLSAGVLAIRVLTNMV